MYLIKFNLTNINRIPSWVQWVKRQFDRQVDASRSMAMKAGHGVDGFVRAQVGRVREGRVDTGVNAPPQNWVSMARIHPVMKELGQSLVGVHWYTHKRAGKMDKHVLVMAYDDKGKPFRLKSHEVRDLKFFQEATWEFCHLWINPEQDNITINLTNLSLDRPARVNVGAQNGHFVFSPSIDLVGA